MDATEIKNRIEAIEFWSSFMIGIIAKKTGISSDVVYQCLIELKNNAPNPDDIGISLEEYDLWHISRMPTYEKFAELLISQIDTGRLR